MICCSRQTPVKSHCLFTLILGFAVNTFAADAEIDAIKEVLRKPRIDWSKWPWEGHAEDLKPFGDRAIPLLATLLENKSFGFDASETMLAIDPNKAAPLIFASMPKCDRNVQFHTFSFFIRRINQGAKLPFVSAIHDAAVHCLEAGTPADAAEQALIAIGLTGSGSDFPLLERIHEKSRSNRVWDWELKNASEAALARLGNEESLKRIETILAAPVPARIPEESAGTLNAAIIAAGFSQNLRFTHFLATHLADRLVEIPPSDNEPLDPAGAARISLYEIINQTSSGMDYVNIDFSKLDKWWNANKQKFENGVN